MTTYNNAKQVGAATPFAAGALYIDRQVTNLAAFKAIGLANGDSVQIGVVPAGCVLVPQLSQIQVPVLDSAASPTVKYKIGSVATPAALAAEKTPGAAASVVKPADFLLTTPFGSPTDDTPIYLTLSAAIATQATTGKIVADVALRAWNSTVDA